MLKLSVENLLKDSLVCDDFQSVGTLHSAQGLLTARLHARLGELVEVESVSGPPVLAEVIGFDAGLAQLMSYEPVYDLYPQATVCGLNRRLTIPAGDELLGRVLDGIGRPIDNGGALLTTRRVDVEVSTPASLMRPKITRPLITGQRVIDAFMTCGLGQRLAILAGSGVGKSTLLGEIAKNSNADVNVVALIGERGREVAPFLHDCVGEQGLAKSVVVVATAEQMPLMRVRAAQAAVAIADDFRRQGKHVLLLFDSVTRLAMAQREIGLLMREPPSARGYTPSVFQRLSHLLEQLGTDGNGSITGMLTVLVDGDDLEEPITDAVRATVDGHLVLDRKLAEKGHYPAVNVAKSISRVAVDVTSARHRALAQKIRAVMATHAEVADLIRIGAYASGSTPSVDKAIELQRPIEALLRQNVGEFTPLEQTLARMEELASNWPY